MNSNIKKRYIRPDESKVKEELKNYKSDLKLMVSDKHKTSINSESGIESALFEDVEYSKPLPLIAINSLNINGNFEIETYIEDEKIHLRLTSVRDSKFKDGETIYGYVDIILNSYEDLLKLSDNLYTRTELSQSEHSHKSLYIKDIIKKNQLYKKTIITGTVIGLLSVLYNRIKKKVKI